MDAVVLKADGGTYEIGAYSNGIRIVFNLFYITIVQELRLPYADELRALKDDINHIMTSIHYSNDIFAKKQDMKQKMNNLVEQGYGEIILDRAYALLHNYTEVS